MLFLLPLHLSEAERLGLASAPGPSGDALALAVSQAHQGQWTEAIKVLRPLTRQPGLQADLARLTLAVLLTERGRLTAGLRLAWEALPYLTLHREASILIQLLTAEVCLRRGQLDTAIQAAMQAEAQATTPGTRHLRGPALCLWAQALHAQDQTVLGLAQANRALRLASTPLTRYGAAATLAALHLRAQPYTAAQHSRKAVALAPSRRRREQMEALLDQAIDNLHLKRLPGGAVTPHRRREVRLSLLCGPALTIDGVRHDAARHPRVVLLLSFLLQEPYAALATAAEMLLSDAPLRRVKYTDEARRAARIRQAVSRARQLLGDPGVVICEGGTLRLSDQYIWHSDLTDGLHSCPECWATLSPSLACEWLDDLRQQGHLNATPDRG